MALKGQKTTSDFLEWEKMQSLVLKLERDGELKFALLIATGLGVLFNYKTAAALVFQTPGKRRIFRVVLAYSLVYERARGLNFFGSILRKF